MINSTSSPDLGSTWRYLHAQWRRVFGLNISQVEPLLFVGGQFRPTQWPALRALGIRAVLSLQQEREDRFSGEPPERIMRLLVPDYHPPALEQLREAVEFIGTAHAAGLPVFVHCHAGVGRAPITAAAYLIASRRLHHGSALDLVRRGRPIIGPNPLQLARLREWEQSVHSRGEHEVRPARDHP
jgi:protein-tyrosine phosphatase